MAVKLCTNDWAFFASSSVDTAALWPFDSSVSFEFIHSAKARIEEFVIAVKSVVAAATDKLFFASLSSASSVGLLSVAVLFSAVSSVLLSSDPKKVSFIISSIS